MEKQITFIVLQGYTFIIAFMCSILSVYQHENYKLSQIVHTGPLTRLCKLELFAALNTVTASPLLKLCSDSRRLKPEDVGNREAASRQQICICHSDGQEASAKSPGGP